MVHISYNKICSKPERVLNFLQLSWIVSSSSSILLILFIGSETNTVLEEWKKKIMFGYFFFPPYFAPNLPFSIDVIFKFANLKAISLLLYRQLAQWMPWFYWLFFIIIIHFSFETRSHRSERAPFQHFCILHIWILNSLFVRWWWW